MKRKGYSESLKLATLLSLSIQFICSINCYPQSKEKHIVFGQFSSEEIEMEDVEFDKGAEAVVLYDYGDSQYSSGKVSYKWHYRVKILTDEGVRWKSVEEANDGILTFKASTFNFKDGIVRETKVDDKLIKRLTHPDSSDIILQMPDVVKGSIIEIYYESSYPVRQWNFQYSIPVIWSEFIVRFPENIEYSRSIVGPHIPYIVETKIVDCDWSERCTQERVVMKNIPRLRIQRHMPNPENYQSAVNFLIDSRSRSYSSFGREYTYHSKYHITEDWNAIADFFRDLYFVSDEVRFLSKLKPIAISIKKSRTTSMEVVDSLFKYVKQRIEWSGEHSLYSQSNTTANRTTRPNYLLGALEEGEGNSAEINLIMLSMLRYAGFTADPVLVSTKDNGLIRIDNPTSNQLNHIIVLTTIDNKKLLIDCTVDNLPLNYLPRESLNGVGLVIFQDRFEWQEINNNSNSRMDISAEITIDKNYLSRRTKLSTTGYYAQVLREDTKQYNINKSLENNRIASIFQIDSQASVANLNSYLEAFTVEFTNTTFNGRAGDTLWFAPIDRIEIDTLYLSDEDRLYAFDIEYPRMENYTTKLKIPAGYSIKSIPAAKMLILPDRSGKFVFNAINNGQDVTIICQLSLSKSIYDIDEYEHVKELLRVASSKLREPLVFQKVE